MPDDSITAADSRDKPSDAQSGQSAAESAAGPDWSTIDYEIECPLCRYNLWGLREPRCPECGYRFEWPDLLNPQRRRHDYLFEHHPERNLWSFRKTTLGALRPKRFWTELHPVQPSRPRRLAIYWLAGVVFLIAGVLSLWGGIVIGTTWHSKVFQSVIVQQCKNNQDFTDHVIRRYGSVSNYINKIYPVIPVSRVLQNHLQMMSRFSRPHFLFRRPDVVWNIFLVLLIAASAWTWCTLAALLVFQWSLRKAKFKQIHLFRCVLYSFDLFPWLITCVLAVLLLLIFIYIDPQGFEQPFCCAIVLLILLTGAFNARRLYWACRNYLRFDHAFGVVLSTQVITLLVVTTVIMLNDSIIRSFM